MNSDLRGLLLGFVIGLAGWLAVASAGPLGDGGWVTAFLIGALAAAVSQRWSGLLGLVVGILVAYPIALELGVIAFLGENWEIAVAFGLALASAGFIASRAVGLAIEASRSRPDSPSK